jgi:hypothetical protein
MASSPTTRDVVANRVLGQTILASEIAPGSLLGYDLVFADTGTGQDLVLADGPHTLAQDLAIAMITSVGSDIFNVQFGFDGLSVLTRNIDRSAVQDFLRLAVVKTLGADTRVKQVNSVTIGPADPNHPETRVWQVAADVQTVLGDVLKIVLGQVNSP